MTTLQAPHAAPSPCVSLKGKEKFCALQAVLRWHVLPLGKELRNPYLQSANCWLPPIVSGITAAG